jgi:hypothetical protein
MVIILIAAPALLAGTAAVPEAGVNVLIGVGLVAGACISRWRRRAR